MYSEITKCIVCEKDVTKVYDVGVLLLPCFAGDGRVGYKAPLTLVKCVNCHLIQLGYAVQQNKLAECYSSQYTIGKSAELLLIAQKAGRSVDLQQGDLVLDIGCNDGTLLGWYSKGVTTVGVDPNKEILAEGMVSSRIDVALPHPFSIETIEMLNKTFTSLGKVRFKIITCVDTFAMARHPVQFLKDCKSCLHDEGVLILQVKYLMSILSNCGFDQITWHNLAYYSVTSLKECIARAGLELQGVEINKTGDLRAYITHKGFDRFHESDYAHKLWMAQNEELISIREMKAHINTTFPIDVFKNNVRPRIDKMREFLIDLEVKGKSVYAYGACTTGSVLLQTLCQDTKVKGIATQDFKLIELRNELGIRVVNMSEVREQATHLLVLPWYQKSVILKEETEWINGNHRGIMIFPLPTPCLATPLADEIPTVEIGKLA